MERGLETAIQKMTDEIVSILGENVLSIYTYGSCVLGDFKNGWSDIDILVLTKGTIAPNQADKLLTLRQQLLEREPENVFYRKFEGAMLSFDAFANGQNDTVVYWGTRGEKIKDNYCLDSFSMKQLVEDGKLLHGKDVKIHLSTPTFENLHKDIVYHYQTIRQHGQTPARNLYSFGWFLDISRCLYTLRTGKIISKTKAGYWALENHLCPNEGALKMSLKVRENPALKEMTETMDYAETLADSIRQYADVLENEFENMKQKKNLVS